jgi:hypothetical protein
MIDGYNEERKNNFENDSLAMATSRFMANNKIINKHESRGKKNPRSRRVKIIHHLHIICEEIY